jgi:hypothetical protein
MASHVDLLFFLPVHHACRTPSLGPRNSVGFEKHAGTQAAYAEIVKTLIAVMFVTALAACGGGSTTTQDMSASTDLSSAACSAMGGHCIGVEDSCEVQGLSGTTGGQLGCQYLCCLPPPICDFPQCDGGACECPAVGQMCQMSGQICTCADGTGGVREWSCTDI